MSAATTPPPKEPTPQETNALLRRILGCVEKDERTRWVEITCAVVLSLASMSSAWCAYQAKLWSGVQTFRLAAANGASRDSAAAILQAMQLQAFDASMFISYMNAKNEGNERQEKFLFNRFRPEMKKPMEAWLKTDPFNNPNAPMSPFKITGADAYVQPDVEKAKEHDDLAERAKTAAREANANADTYVLLTVMFATVLFFGGVAGSVASRRLRIAILAIALTLFVVTLFVLATMPICRE